MIKRLLPAIVAAGLMSSCLFGQGMNTRASKGDWEEINFEFNSPVLTDGYPSLLRLADMLKQHPDYKVQLTGNADQIGSNRYNDKLSVARANTVAQFLQKYGAAPNQIQVKGEGKRNPEVPSSTKLARWINRRVVMTVTGPNGNVVAEGGVSDVLPDFKKELDSINAKLDKLKSLDDILSQLDNLKSQVAALKGDTTTIIQGEKEIKTDTVELVKRPPPLSYEQTDEIAHRAANYALTQNAIRNKKYSLIGLNVGPTFMPGRTGNFSATAYGKALLPFGNGKTPDMPGTHAIQIGAQWLYWPQRTEGQFDAALVERFSNVQAGVFVSYLESNFRSYHGGASLGQAGFKLDYIFPYGKIGLFAAKGIHDDRKVERGPLGVGPGLAMMRVEDQIGYDAQVAFLGNSYLEGSFAYKKSLARGLSTKPASMLRLVLPMSEMFAITAEASVNTTFQNLSDGGRVVFGFQFGNWLRPRSYFTTQGPVPIEVPNLHYELLRQ